jgi:hypothetical protein
MVPIAAINGSQKDLDTTPPQFNEFLTTVFQLNTNYFKIFNITQSFIHHFNDINFTQLSEIELLKYLYLN